MNANRQSNQKPVASNQNRSLTPPTGEARPSGGLPSPRRGEGWGEGKISGYWLLVTGYLVIATLFSLDAPAAEDKELEHGPLARPFVVIGRGFGNFAGLPFEILGTAVREHDIHPKLWPVTYLPRLATNVLIRVASVVNDIFFLPWIASRADDLSPWTEPMGLPDYPWQRE